LATPAQPKPGQLKQRWIRPEPNTEAPKSPDRTSPGDLPPPKRTPTSQESPFSGLAGAPNLAGVDSNLNSDSRLEAALVLSMFDTNAQPDVQRVIDLEKSALSNPPSTLSSPAGVQGPPRHNFAFIPKWQPSTPLPGGVGLPSDTQDYYDTDLANAANNPAAPLLFHNNTRSNLPSPEKPTKEQIGACRKSSKGGKHINIMADLELAMRQMGLGF